MKERKKGGEGETQSDISSNGSTAELGISHINHEYMHVSESV